MRWNGTVREDSTTSKLPHWNYAEAPANRAIRCGWMWLQRCRCIRNGRATGNAERTLHDFADWRTNNLSGMSNQCAVPIRLIRKADWSDYLVYYAAHNGVTFTTDNLDKLKSVPTQHHAVTAVSEFIVHITRHNQSLVERPCQQFVSKMTVIATYKKPTQIQKTTKIQKTSRQYNIKGSKQKVLPSFETQNHESYCRPIIIKVLLNVCRKYSASFKKKKVNLRFFTNGSPRIGQSARQIVLMFGVVT